MFDNVDAAIGWAAQEMMRHGVPLEQMVECLAEVEARERAPVDDDQAEDIRHPDVQRALSCAPDQEAATREAQAGVRKIRHFGKFFPSKRPFHSVSQPEILSEYFTIC